MTAGARRIVSPAVRLLIVAGAVWWLARDLNWSDLWSRIQFADRRLLLAGLLTFGPAPILIAIRLKWLLAVHNVHLTTREAIRVTFGGNFLIWALPLGTSGGDAAKAVYIAKDTPHKHEAFTTVFFDRLVGVIGLVLMSAGMVLVNWQNPALAARGRVIGLLSLGFFAGAAVYFSGRLRTLLRLDAILARLPLAEHIQRIDRAVFAFRHRGKRVAGALGLTMVLQLISIVSLYLTGWGLGLVGDDPLRAFPLYLSYLPICFLTGALPLGFMEVTFKELFSPEGPGRLGPPEAAVSLAIMARIIQLLWALPGAIVVLRSGRPRGAAALEASLAAPVVQEGVPSGCVNTPS